MSSTSAVLPFPLALATEEEDDELARALRAACVQPFDKATVWAFKRQVSQQSLPRAMRFLPTHVWFAVGFAFALFFLVTLALTVLFFLCTGYSDEPTLVTLTTTFGGICVASLIPTVLLGFATRKMLVWWRVACETMTYPAAVRDVKVRIQRELWNAEFVIERTRKDPFLVVQYGGREEYVAWWPGDDTGFNA